MAVTTDYRQDDDHWWVSFTLPEGGFTNTLTTFRENAKPGTMTLWFATSHLGAAHKALGDKGIKVSEVQDNLHSPGSGVKRLNFKDPVGNLIHLEQANL